VLKNNLVVPILGKNLQTAFLFCNFALEKGVTL